MLPTPGRERISERAIGFLSSVMDGQFFGRANGGYGEESFCITFLKGKVLLPEQ